MRNYFLLIAFGLLACNSKEEKIRNNQAAGNHSLCFIYPAQVARLHLEDLYDSARWYIYTWHCDSKYQPKYDSSKSKTFGELPLRFINLSLKGDTAELNFDFIDNGQPIITSMTRNRLELSTGV